MLQRGSQECLAFLHGSKWVEECGLGGPAHATTLEERGGHGVIMLNGGLINDYMHEEWQQVLRRRQYK